VVGSRKAPVHKKPSGATAADHTYDKGYKRWEEFDVDAAMKDDEREWDPEGGNGEETVTQLEASSSPSPVVTPATITADAAR